MNENDIKKCCANANYTLEESAQLEADVIMKRAQIELLKHSQAVGTTEKLKYTAEMALFEIWGAIQTSDSTYDIQNIARAAMERAGLMEVKNDGRHEA